MRSKYKPDNFNRKENNPDNYKWGIFYCNPDDTRIIVQKRSKRMGWAFNFANLWSYVILGLFIVIAIVVATL